MPYPQSDRWVSGGFGSSALQPRVPYSNVQKDVTGVMKFQLILAVVGLVQVSGQYYGRRLQDDIGGGTGGSTGGSTGVDMGKIQRDFHYAVGHGDLESAAALLLQGLLCSFSCPSSFLVRDGSRTQVFFPSANDLYSPRSRMLPSVL